jgi:4-hydroxy-tetrahydrodipicolinate synthase
MAFIDLIFRIKSFSKKELIIMERKPIFTGAASALITPMTSSGVDYENFKKLINWQIEEGIDALVIAGTSGEASTLTDEEHREVLKFAVEVVDGRVPVIAGTGSNDTDYAIDLTKYACEIGCDAMLVVTPYYNKATQKGLIKMFTAIADASTKPVILYNVPSRTGVNIEPATYAALADHPMIQGIKEANGQIDKITETMALCGDKLDLYSGNDDQIVPLMSIGGKGVISVLSNVLPKETSEMVHKFLAGDVQGAAQMQFKYFGLIKALFSEVNPIPAKAAMAAMGFCEDYVRLPLTCMEDATKAVLLDRMREAGLDV